MLESIERVAARLAQLGWTMRTGMSPGVDQAFYRGALAGRGAVELYLPWPAFQILARSRAEGRRVIVQAQPTDAACSLAARFHPGWRALSARERRLRARDVHQVLGRDLLSAAAFIVCWTPDGSVDGEDPRVGGSGQALRIAHARGIAVLNLARPEHSRTLSRQLWR